MSDAVHSAVQAGKCAELTEMQQRECVSPSAGNTFVCVRVSRRAREQQAAVAEVKLLLYL